MTDLLALAWSLLVTQRPLQGLKRKSLNLNFFCHFVFVLVHFCLYSMPVIIFQNRPNFMPKIANHGTCVSKMAKNRKNFAMVENTEPGIFGQFWPVLAAVSHEWWRSEGEPGFFSVFVFSPHNFFMNFQKIWLKEIKSLQFQNSRQNLHVAVPGP